MGSRCFNKRLVSPLPSLSPSPSLPRLLSSRGQTGQLRRHRLFASEKQSFFSLRRSARPRPPVLPPICPFICRAGESAALAPTLHLQTSVAVSRPRPFLRWEGGRRRAEGGGESGEGAATPRPTQPQRVRSLNQIMTGNFSRPDKTSFAGNLEQAEVFR